MQLCCHDTLILSHSVVIHAVCAAQADDLMQQLHNVKRDYGWSIGIFVTSTVVLLSITGIWCTLCLCGIFCGGLDYFEMQNYNNNKGA